jgi:proliferating cell nuclear antigen
MLNITARSDLMRTIIDTLNVVVEEARFDFNEDALNIRVVDPSHVAMIEMNVDAAAFERYEVENSSLGFDLPKMKDLLSLATSGEMVEMDYDKNGQVNINLGKIDRVIRPLDPANLSPPNVPDLPLNAMVDLNGNDLSQALRAARQVGDLVNLSLEENLFTVHVSGDTDSVNVSYNSDEVNSIECTSPVRSQFSLTYLLPIARIMANVDSVRLRFDENKPLKIEFEFADGAGSVTYFLAPRVEGDL